jgi:hypothetical protein
MERLFRRFNDMANGKLRRAVGSLLLAFVAGCAGAPLMTSADDVLRFKSEGADDSALLVWVQDPARAFNLTETDFDRLSKARINEAVIGELRWRSEEYRRSGPPMAEKQKPADRPAAADGHRH